MVKHNILSAQPIRPLDKGRTTVPRFSFLGRAFLFENELNFMDPKENAPERGTVQGRYAEKESQFLAFDSDAAFHHWMNGAEI